MCEVSKPIANILRITLDEEFRKKCLDILGVTNCTDAEEVLQQNFQEILSGSRHGLENSQSSIIPKRIVSKTPNSRLKRKKTNSAATTDQPILHISTPQQTSIENAFNHLNSQQVSENHIGQESFCKPNLQDDDECEFWESTFTNDVKDNNASLSKVQHKKTEINLDQSFLSLDNMFIFEKSSVANVNGNIQDTQNKVNMQSQSIIQNDDEFEFWDHNRPITHNEPEALLQGMTSNNGNTQSQSIIIQNDEFEFWDHNRPITHNEPEALLQGMTSNNRNTQSQSIIQNDEFEFWVHNRTITHNEPEALLQGMKSNNGNTQSQSITQNDVFEFWDHNRPITHNEPEALLQGMKSNNGNTQSQSIIQNDEFEFWDHNRPITHNEPEALLQGMKSNNGNTQSQSIIQNDEFEFWDHNGPITHNEPEALLQGMTSNNGNTQSQSITQNDEFEFWDHNRPITHNEPEALLQGMTSNNGNVQSQSIIQNDDEFEFWDHNRPITHNEPKALSQGMASNNGNMQSQSIIQNDDEFEFWDHNRPITHNEPKSLLQGMASNNGNIQSQSIIQNDDEFEFWDHNKPITHNKPQVLLPGVEITHKTLELGTEQRFNEIKNAKDCFQPIENLSNHLYLHQSQNSQLQSHSIPQNDDEFEFWSSTDKSRNSNGTLKKRNSAASDQPIHCISTTQPNSYQNAFNNLDSQQVSENHIGQDSLCKPNLQDDDDEFEFWKSTSTMK